MTDTRVALLRVLLFTPESRQTRHFEAARMPGELHAAISRLRNLSLCYVVDERGLVRGVLLLLNRNTYLNTVLVHLNHS